MSPNLQDLRQHLREKLPDAHQSRPVETSTLSSSLTAFPKGALTELSLVLTKLLNSGCCGSQQLTIHHR
ncbi:MAG: hypothetical protein OSA48_06535 [Akkermansiaceae bacterium]|nr:hypothetical protein [Akkermansiaceae bacterium]